jgi:hypothetical protein
MSTSMERETLVTISPTTNRPILTRYGPSDEELALLVQRARRAFEEFRAGPQAFARRQQPQQQQQQDDPQKYQQPQAQQEKLQRVPGLKERQEIVARALELLKVRRDELGRELTEQMGRPIAYTAKEVTTAIARAEYLLRISDDALAVTPGEEEVGYKRYIKKEPVGVVLVIFAWNVWSWLFISTLLHVSVWLPSRSSFPSVLSTSNLPSNLAKAFVVFCRELAQCLAYCKISRTIICLASEDEETAD